MSLSTKYRVYENEESLLVRLPVSIFSRMKEHVFGKYPKEFGGILIGRIEGNCAEIEEIEVPERYKNSRVHFVRKKGSINRKLKALHARTGGQSYYLGEWHSHPDCPPEPSETDFLSMQAIAENKRVRMETPILFILSVDERRECKEICYWYSEGELKKYKLIK